MCVYFAVFFVYFCSLVCICMFVCLSVLLCIVNKDEYSAVGLKTAGHIVLDGDPA